jgi:hypothetical protein
LAIAVSVEGDASAHPQGININGEETAQFLHETFHLAALVRSRQGRSHADGVGVTIFVAFRDCNQLALRRAFFRTRGTMPARERLHAARRF